MITSQYDTMTLNQILKQFYVENVAFYKVEIKDMITCHCKGYLNQEGQDKLKLAIMKIMKFNDVHNFPDRTIVDISINNSENLGKVIRCYKFNGDYVNIKTKEIIYCIDGDCYNSTLDAHKRTNALSITLKKVVNTPTQKRSLAS